MKKRNVLDSPRLSKFKKRRRRALWGKFILVFLVFILIFSGLVYLSRIKKLNINTIKIEKNKLVDAESIQEIVDANLSEQYLWFFPKTNILFYPKRNIKRDLYYQFPRLKNVSLKLKDLRVLIISVSEREGKYIWCGETLPKVTIVENSPCYFMDEMGYIFDTAPYFSGDVYFRFYGALDNISLGDSPFRTTFSSATFGKIIAFSNYLLTLDIKPTSLYMKGKDIEIYLSSNTLPPNSPKIIIKNAFDLEKISSNLEAAINTEPLKSNFIDKYNALEYIDLRSGNKVYFKFK